jgi:hypothetical protein
MSDVTQVCRSLGSVPVSWEKDTSNSCMESGSAGSAPLSPACMFMSITYSSSSSSNDISKSVDAIR